MIQRQNLQRSFPLFSGLESKSIGLSVMWILFAYTGWNAAAYIGSEVKQSA